MILTEVPFVGNGDSSILQESSIAPSSEHESGNNEHQDKAHKSRQSKNHARHSLVLKGLVDGNNNLGGRSRGIDERSYGVDRTSGSRFINGGKCCRREVDVVVS